MTQHHYHMFIQAIDSKLNDGGETKSQNFQFSQHSTGTTIDKEDSIITNSIDFLYHGKLYMQADVLHNIVTGDTVDFRGWGSEWTSKKGWV